LAEFDFRYNERASLFVTDAERTEKAVKALLANGSPIKKLMADRSAPRSSPSRRAFESIDPAQLSFFSLWDE
jgi:hypothetical protein